jgi:hypothetical protein
MAISKFRLSPTSEIWIKPLDWKERYQINTDQKEEVVGYVATTGLGAPYRIERDYFNTKEWQVTYGGVLGNFTTSDEAKSAAKADYEGRVLGCLVQP